MIPIVVLGLLSRLVLEVLVSALVLVEVVAVETTLPLVVVIPLRVALIIILLIEVIWLPLVVVLFVTWVVRLLVGELALVALRLLLILGHKLVLARRLRTSWGLDVVERVVAVLRRLS